jgi:putative hydrolase
MPAEEPEDFEEMLRKLFENGEQFDITEFAKAAGLPADPAALEAMLAQFRQAMQQGEEGISEKLVRETATGIANKGAVTQDSKVIEAAENALKLAELWLDEATGISPLASTPTTLTRAEWVRATLPAWIQISQPVANSIAVAAESALKDQLEEDAETEARSAFTALRRVGGTLFSMQLGQILGQISAEVLSGGDIGIPLLDGKLEHELRAVLIPQNVALFANGLDISIEDVSLYLAIREIAHARLFKHAKWLKHSLITSITGYANGISIDTESMREALENIDLSDSDALRRVVSDGSLIPPKTDEQRIALGQIETVLALVEGWVDVVSDEAASRLPSRGAISEMVRRNRAAGRPGERSLSGLIGIDARPRRLREAAAMWKQIGDEIGKERRDEIWAHPDLLPTADDITDPSGILARLKGPVSSTDDFDDELRKILDEGAPE